MQVDQRMIGYPVHDRNGFELGKVKEIQGHSFKVDAPMQRDYWLGDECVDDTTADIVRLAVDRDELDRYKLDHPGDLGSLDRGSMGPTATAVPPSSVPAGTITHTTGLTGQDTMRLHEERLQATTHPVQAGEVAIGKEVVSEERSIDVPVRHEELVVERHPIEGTPTPGELHPNATDQEIRVPLHEEQVHVEKQTVPIEEIRVGTQQVQETQQVRDTVHREEAHLERQGDVPVRGWDDVAAGYRQRWQGQSGSTGGRWEDQEPGYRFGYEMAHDPRYRGRRFEDLEPELRSSYGPWAQSYGYPADDSAWDRARLGIREAFDHPSGQELAA